MLNGGGGRAVTGYTGGPLSPHMDGELCTVLFLLSAGTSVSKESTWNAGHLDLIPGLGRSPGEGNGKPLQYSCWKKRSQSVGSQESGVT